MYMRFRSNGIRHQAIREKTGHLNKDQDSPVDDLEDLTNQIDGVQDGVAVSGNVADDEAVTDESPQKGEDSNNNKEEADTADNDYGYSYENNTEEDPTDGNLAEDDMNNNKDLGPEDRKEVERFDEDFEALESYMPL